MSIWDYPIHHVAHRLDCDQFRFLTARPPEPYLAILIELYRARQEDLTLEVPFETLHGRVASDLEQYRPSGGFEPIHLRQYLNQLEDWSNIAMRLEPKRIRRIEDRGLERYLVRLTESTSTILGQIESRLEQLDRQSTSSARFSLLEVDDALGAVLALLESDAQVKHDEYCRAGRELARARRAVEEAGDELLRLDLWLSETAVQPPSRDRLAELLVQLETYFERYLQDVDRRRQLCHEKLGRLTAESAGKFLARVQEATEREFAEDPTRQGRCPLEPRQILRAVGEFLEPEGILDQRRMAVHERLADVAGHLKRYLAELVRRSQLVAGLRELARRLFHAPDGPEMNGQVDRLFLELWQPAHAVLDENGGSPVAQVEPPRPYRYRAATRRRFAGASVRPSGNGRSSSGRPSLVKQMEHLSEFIHRAILRGGREAFVSEAVLDDLTEVRLLIAAVRTARLDRSRLRRRYLHYRVTYPTVAKEVTLAPKDGSGRLHLPQMIFSSELTR